MAGQPPFAVHISLTASLKNVYSDLAERLLSIIQRQVRLYLRAHDQQIPGNKGLTATPTAAVVLALFAQVALIQ